MIESKEALSLDPIVPLTENSQQYLRLQEAQCQRFSEHAQYVNEAYQKRRQNERQQFQERMSKCPIGLPPKRLSSHTPPPQNNVEFKQPLMPSNQSPQRQWNGSNDVLKKSSPDSLPKTTPTIDPIQAQFQSHNLFRPQPNPTNFPPHQQFNIDPRLAAHPYNYYLAQKHTQNGQFLAQNPALYTQQQMLNQQKQESELLRLQMFYQQQQWQASQMQRMNQLVQQQQMVALNAHHQQQQSPSSSTLTNHNQQQLIFNQLNNKPTDPANSIQQQMNDKPVAAIHPISSEAFFWQSQQYAAFNAVPPLDPKHQFNGQPMSFNVNSQSPIATTTAQSINFIPQTPVQQQPVTPSSISSTSQKPAPVNNKIEQKEPVLNSLLAKATTTTVNDEDDTLALYSTIGEEGLEHNQMMHQYLDNIPDIQTCNFPQISENGIHSSLIN